MPNAPLKPCNKPGCPNLTRERFCAKHEGLKNEKKKQHDKQRGSASSRGYDRKWQRVRALKLATDPLCECEACSKRVRVATMVHHIKPVDKYPELRLEWSNLMSMANECHERIERERGKRW